VKVESIATLAAVAAVGLLGFYVWKKGGVAPAAQALGAGAVNAAAAAVQGAAQAGGQVASNGVGEVGSWFGLPTPSMTVTDPAEARWLIDTKGYLEASRWSGAGALVQGALMPSGSGTPPSINTPAGREHLQPTQAIGDLLQYESDLMAPWPEVTPYYDPMTGLRVN
jgi:hypothetical protein